jgi:hypothetical protein
MPGKKAYQLVEIQTCGRRFPIVAFCYGNGQTALRLYFSISVRRKSCGGYLLEESLDRRIWRRTPVQNTLRAMVAGEQKYQQESSTNSSPKFPNLLLTTSHGRPRRISKGFSDTRASGTSLADAFSLRLERWHIIVGSHTWTVRPTMHDKGLLVVIRGYFGQRAGKSGISIRLKDPSRADAKKVRLEDSCQRIRHPGICGNSERARHMDEAGKSGNEVVIERGVERLDVEFIYELLRQTHWARNRMRQFQGDLPSQQTVGALSQPHRRHAARAQLAN